MKPMNPFERKVVHDVVAAAGLVSDSSGIGQDRHVVITLAEDDIESAEDYEDEFSGDEVPVDSADDGENADVGQGEDSADE